MLREPGFESIVPPPHETGISSRTWKASILPTRVPDKSIPEPWLSFLGDLDAAVETEVRLDCMGGFVVTLVYGFSRTTADLDVLEIAPREAGKPMLQLGMQGGPLHKKHKLYLDLVGVAHVPENYEDRLTETFPKALTRIIHEKT